MVAVQCKLENFILTILQPQNKEKKENQHSLPQIHFLTFWSLPYILHIEVLCVEVFVTAALLFAVCIKAHDFGNAHELNMICVILEAVY